MFMNLDGALTPEDAVRTQVEVHTAKLMKDATQQPFDHWGAFTGVGARLTGKMLGINPASLRVFAWRADERTYTMVELAFDDDRALVGPGLALVERSFVVKAKARTSPQGPQ